MFKSTRKLSSSDKSLNAQAEIDHRKAVRLIGPKPAYYAELQDNNYKIEEREAVDQLYVCRFTRQIMSDPVGLTSPNGKETIVHEKEALIDFFHQNEKYLYPCDNAPYTEIPALPPAEIKIIQGLKKLKENPKLIHAIYIPAQEIKSLINYIKEDNHEYIYRALIAKPWLLFYTIERNPNVLTIVDLILLHCSEKTLTFIKKLHTVLINNERYNENQTLSSQLEQEQNHNSDQVTRKNSFNKDNPNNNNNSLSKKSDLIDRTGWSYSFKFSSYKINFSESFYLRKILFNLIKSKRHEENLGEIINIFNNYNFDANLKSYSGEPIIHYAFRSNNTGFINFLLETQKIDIEIKSYGDNILHTAFRWSDAKTILILINYLNNDIDMKIKLLCQENNNNMKPLNILILNETLNDHEKIEIIKDVTGINNVFTSNQEFIDFISFLIRHGKLSIAKMLIENFNFDCNTCFQTTGNNLLHITAAFVCSLVDKQKKIDDSVIKNFIDYLVKERKVNIDSTNSITQTPLHFAAIHKNSICAEHLVKLGAFTECIDSKEMRPQDYCRSDQKTYNAIVITAKKEMEALRREVKVLHQTVNALAIQVNTEKVAFLKAINELKDTINLLIIPSTADITLNTANIASSITTNSMVNGHTQNPYLLYNSSNWQENGNDERDLNNNPDQSPTIHNN